MRVLRRRVASRFILASVVSVALAAGLYFALVRSSQQRRWIEHTHRVLIELGAVASSLNEATAGVRGYCLTGEEEYLEAHRRSRRAASLGLKALRAFTADNPDQQGRLDELARVVEERFRFNEEVIGVRRGGDAEAAARQVGTGRGERLMGQIRGTIAAMEAEETRLLNRRVLAASSSTRWTFALTLAGTALNLAILVLVYRLIGHEAAERGRAEETLRQSEERFRGAFDAAVVGMAVVAPDGRWLDVNESLCEIFGYGREELLATNFQAITHPDDLEDDLEHARGVLSGSVRSYRLEKRCIHKEGHVVWIALSVSLVRDADGRPLHFISITEDITRRKHAEEALRERERRFRAVFDSTSEFMGLLTPDGRMLEGNRTSLEFVGLAQEDIVGRPFWEGPWWAGSAELRDRLKQAVADAARGQTVRFEADHPGVDGRTVTVDFSIKPVFDESGRVVMLLPEGHDVSARQQAQRELARARDAAEAASRLKGEFLANVSHEIRTPMNAILGMTEITLGTDLTPAQRENLQVVKSATDSLLAIINDLLDFSKMEAGKLRLDPCEFRLRDRLGDALGLLALRAHDKGLELACRIRPDVPEHLVGDPVRLRQVIVNVVGNAIKFTERGDVVVELDAEPAGEDSIQLHFRVSDSGIGIADDKREAIFAPFAQADGSTTRLYGGTGLGLAISAQLVALMGGRIWVESEVGRGSTFHFTARFAPGRGEPPHGPASLDDLRDLPVLVVDDNAVNRRILQEILLHWRMRPTLAEGGHAALAELARARDAGAPYSLVLLDAQMPDMDGFAVAGRIAAAPGLGGATVLMLSSGDRRDGTGRAEAAGVAAYLYKPVQQLELQEAICKALGAKPRGECAPPPRRRDGDRPAARPLRILLAEDNPFNQRVAVLRLAESGHTVTVAANGRLAVEALAAQPFDLVLMDVQMPEMDGLQATAAIRAAEAGTGRRIPIIAMTAHAMKEDRDRCLEAGMDGYVSKPIVADDLRREIEACLARAGEPAAPTADADAPEPHVDLAAALRRVDGDRAFLAEMVALYREERPRLLAGVRAALDEGEPARLCDPAHSLKNWVGNFVAMPAYDVLRRLEQAGRAGDLAEARAAFSELEGEIGRLDRALERFQHWPTSTVEVSC